MTLKSHIFYTFHWKIHESFYEELYYYYIYLILLNLIISIINYRTG